jgi:arsenate reductase
MSTMSITIYHNPNCSKSLKTLEIIESSGIEPNIVEYIKTPPDRDTLLRMAELIGVPLSDLLRRGEADFKNVGSQVPLDNQEALADWLHEHPRVLERPVVIDNDAERGIIGRPPENVLPLLKR